LPSTIPYCTATPPRLFTSKRPSIHLHHLLYVVFMSTFGLFLPSWSRVVDGVSATAVSAPIHSHLHQNDRLTFGTLFAIDLVLSLSQFVSCAVVIIKNSMFRGSMLNGKEIEGIGSPRGIFSRYTVPFATSYPCPGACPARSYTMLSVRPSQDLPGRLQPKRARPATSSGDLFGLRGGAGCAQYNVMLYPARGGVVRRAGCGGLAPPYPPRAYAHFAYGSGDVHEGLAELAEPLRPRCCGFRDSCMRCCSEACATLSAAMLRTGTMCHRRAWVHAPIALPYSPTHPRAELGSRKTSLRRARHVHHANFFLKGRFALDHALN
ncbi:hypothetical protein B0H19DRAFT_1327799, partial [Mycena capillaripes]